MTVVNIPTLHPDQERAYNLPARFKAIRCGRRWGKTEFGVTVAANAAIHGKMVGWFAPEYKFLAEPYAKVRDILQPVTVRSSEGQGIIRTTKGGGIDIWSLDNPIAGRGRKYHWIIIDEAAFGKPNLFDIWKENLRATLIDYRGKALALSNANWADQDNFFWRICNEPEHGFKDFHATSMHNPHIPPDELELFRKTMHPMVYQGNLSRVRR